MKLRAHSPGKFPILIVELSPGDLRTLYYETGYDLQRSKQVSEQWMHDNAIGRHSFMAVDPPRNLPAPAIMDYVRRELLQES